MTVLCLANPKEAIRDAHEKCHVTWHHRMCSPDTSIAFGVVARPRRRPSQLGSKSPAGTQLWVSPA